MIGLVARLVPCGRPQTALEKPMRLWLTVFAILLVPGRVFAAGFVGPGAPEPVHLAAQALSAGDDAPALLEGRILSKIAGRKDRYLLEDASGQIIVKIKKKVFAGRTVTPANRVRIEGEVEADDKYPNEVEAESLTVLE